MENDENGRYYLNLILDVVFIYILCPNGVHKIRTALDLASQLLESVANLLIEHICLKLLDTVEKLKYPPYIEESIHRIRGYFYRDGLGKYEEAVKSFEKALAVPNVNAAQKAVLWNNIGMAYEKDEEYEKAVEAFKKVGTFGVSGWFVKSAENSAVRLQKKIDAGE